MRNCVVAVFGGAFDPVHFGHIKPALYLSRHDVISRVVFVPARLHPFKGRIGNGCSDDDRLAMLKLIVRPPKLQISSHEIEADGVVHTVDTLRYFRSELGQDVPLAFVVGEDAFNEIDGWREYRRLPELAHLIVIRRPGFEYAADHPLIAASGGCSSLEDLAGSPAGRICLLDNEPVTVSSTEVRRLLDGGRQPRYMMPGVVWNYIRRNCLYGYDDV